MSDWTKENRGREIRKDSPGSYMEQRLKDGQCMYCGAELWKREYRSTEGGVCVGCKIKSQEHLKGYQEYVDSVIMPRKSRVTKADLKAMDKYAKPIESVSDDDVPF